MARLFRARRLVAAVALLGAVAVGTVTGGSSKAASVEMAINCPPPAATAVIVDPFSTGGGGPGC